MIYHFHACTSIWFRQNYCGNSRESRGFFVNKCFKDEMRKRYIDENHLINVYTLASLQSFQDWLPKLSWKKNKYGQYCQNGLNNLFRETSSADANTLSTRSPDSPQTLQNVNVKTTVEKSWQFWHISADKYISIKGKYLKITSHIILHTTIIEITNGYRGIV